MFNLLRLLQGPKTQLGPISQRGYEWAIEVLKLFWGLILIIMLQSGHNFVQVTTAKLSWHVQKCNTIWYMLFYYNRTIFFTFQNQFFGWFTCGHQLPETHGGIIYRFSRTLLRPIPLSGGLLTRNLRWVTTSIAPLYQNRCVLKICFTKLTYKWGMQYHSGVQIPPSSPF